MERSLGEVYLPAQVSEVTVTYRRNEYENFNQSQTVKKYTTSSAISISWMFKVEINNFDDFLVYTARGNTRF